MNKEEKIIKLEERIKKLKSKQSLILGYGGDDLEIREEIAETEDKLNELYSEGEKK